MGTDLVSVIVPARDVERLLGRTLESALRQTHRELEVVVVDDGSTDGTAEVVADFAARDPRVRLERSSHIGVSAARNLALARSTGPFVAPLDADDLWHPEKLTRQLEAMRAAGPSVGVVYCWSVGIDEQDRVVMPTWNGGTASGDVLREMVVRGVAGNGSTPLIRRECIEAVGGYDEASRPSEDWRFYTALAGVCEFAVVPEHLTGYRLRDDSASMDVLAMEAAIRRVTAWIRETWPDLPSSVFRERAFTVEAYLAFLAIRQRHFGPALRHLGSALRARPAKLFSRSWTEMAALWIAHATGLRCYRWDFWRRPPLAFAPPPEERGNPESAAAPR